MKALRIPQFFLAVLISAAVSGCGGGSGSGGGTGSISGRISELVALPAAGRAADDAARISVEGTTLSVTTAADGSFSIQGVPPGLHTIIARTPTHAAAISARVSAGKETKIGEVALREAGQISGLVTSAETGAPIASARVTVTELIYENTSATSPHPVRITRTTGSGSYTIESIPAGEYLVTVDKEGFDSESLYSYVMPFSTTAGDLRLHAADASAKGVLRGTAYAVDEDGSKSPVAGVLVRVVSRGSTEPPMPPFQPLPGEAIGAGGAAFDLYPSAGRSHSYRELYTYSDENGAYILDGIPAGEYIAAAVRPGLVPEEKNVTISATAPAEVDFLLQIHRPRIGTIEGRVVNADSGEPIANAQVSLLPGPMPMPPVYADPAAGTGYVGPGAVGGGGSPGSIGGGSGGIYIVPDEYDFYTVTDAQGRFRMRAPAGEVLVDVWAEGYLPGQQTVSVPLNGSVAAEFKLAKHVTREVTLSGRVLASGSPVAGATVYASPISDHYHIMGRGAESGVVKGGSRMHPYVVYQADTDSDGSFALKLQSGAYYVYATKDNLISDPVRMDILDDMNREFLMKETDFPPPPGGRKR